MIIRIASADRISASRASGFEQSTPERGTYELSEPLHGTYELVYAVVPHVVAPVGRLNRSLTYSVGRDVETTVQLAGDEYYTAEDLVAALQAALGASFAVTMDQTSHKMTIRAGSATTFYSETARKTSSLAPVLGLTRTASGTSVTFTAPLNLAFPTSLRVQVNHCVGVVDSTSGAGWSFTIPVDVNTHEVAVFDATRFKQTILIPEPTKIVHILFTDGRGRALVGMSDWEMYLRHVC